MKKSLLFCVIFLSTPVLAEAVNSISCDSSDGVMAKVYGTCTRQVCPPGTHVKVYPPSDGESVAIKDDGEVVDLTNLTKIKFTISSNEEKHSCNVIAATPDGQRYVIQRSYLKKK